MAPTAKSQRRSARQTASASRKRSIYVDPDTDDDFEAMSDNGEADFEPQSSRQTHPTPRKRQRTSTRAQPQSQSQPQSRSRRPARHGRSAKTNRSVMPAIGKPRKPNRHGEAIKSRIFTGPSDGCIPAWTTLPLEILRDIFIYASHPVQEETRSAADNITWLMRTARICRAFSVPALEAFYQSPALLTTSAPHQLLGLLQLPIDGRFMDYNVKIHGLRIGVRQLAYTAHNKPLFNISTLIPVLPQLRHLEITHPIDEPPFRGMLYQHWRYPPELFTALRTYGHRLRSWRWSRDMIRREILPRDLYPMMAQTHLGEALRSLRRLVVCGFNVSDSAEPQPPEDGSAILAPGLATSIALLPNLTDLTFISCDVVVDNFLSRLPGNLSRLELTNCLELTSDMLHAYLTTSGSSLRDLVLNHNPALTLQFLLHLRNTCPFLHLLQMDLRYYSERVNSNDAEPLYDTLLSAEECPTWPSTLRHLELLHLQKWSAEAARNLFLSLVESADQLPDLRHLALWTHISIPWRDRVGFREQWIERLARVYLRVPKEPKLYLGSLRQFRLWKNAQSHAGRSSQLHATLISDDDELEENGNHAYHVTARKLSHIRVSPHHHSGDTQVFSDSSPDKETRPRRSQRVVVAAASASASCLESEDDHDTEVDSNKEPSADDWRRRPEKHVQGLCNVVDVRIDNQRPRETQWTEGDFLDDEVSGDEEWREGDEEDDGEGTGGYAW